MQLTFQVFQIQSMSMTNDVQQFQVSEIGKHLTNEYRMKAMPFSIHLLAFQSSTKTIIVWKYDLPHPSFR
jgi:hypothetical protein